MCVHTHKGSKYGKNIQKIGKKSDLEPAWALRPAPPRTPKSPRRVQPPSSPINRPIFDWAKDGHFPIPTWRKIHHSYKTSLISLNTFIHYNKTLLNLILKHIKQTHIQASNHHCWHLHARCLTWVRPNLLLFTSPFLSFILFLFIAFISFYNIYFIVKMD